MPYGALRYAYITETDPGSPGPVAGLTPVGFDVATPAAVTSVASPPAGSPSGLSQTLRNKNALERAQLFVQGRHHELVRSMEGQEKAYV
jgi:hypothetical protein